jgi:cation transport ATPase
MAKKDGLTSKGQSWACASLLFFVALITIALPILKSEFSFSTITLLAIFVVSVSVLQLVQLREFSVSVYFAVVGTIPALMLFHAGEFGPLASYLAALAFSLQLRLWLFQIANIRTHESMALRQTIDCNIDDVTSVFIDTDIESNVITGLLQEGHIFRAEPGKTIPADGIVTFGSAFVDQRMSKTAPEDVRLKGMGNQVYAGSTVKNGNLLVRITKLGAETFLSRLNSTRRPNPFSILTLAPDLLALLPALAFCFLGRPIEMGAILFTSSGASLIAILKAREFSFARASARHNWLWGKNGAKNLRAAGALVTEAPSVLSEGRPKLVAVETTYLLSEDAAIAMFAPLARKIETPAAFAILLELRTRNIPLQLAEYFEPRNDGGIAFVGGEEIRWMSLEGGELPPLDKLEGFVREHQNSGDEVCLLEWKGAIQAAFAFRDSEVPGTKEAAARLLASGLPVVLVSPFPKRCVAHYISELGLEHVQGESTHKKTEDLVAKLATEGLAPAWIQTGAFRPARAAAAIASAHAALDADLIMPDITLPDIGAAIGFAYRAFSRAKLACATVLGVQVGLVLTILLANPILAQLFHYGNGWVISPTLVAIVGGLPGFVAFLLAHTKDD